METWVFATHTDGRVLQFSDFTEAVRELRLDHTDTEIAESWVLDEYVSTVPGSGPRTHRVWVPTIETTRLGEHLVWTHEPRSAA